ncbi:YgdI/YgdR family lipoprotein [Klebsiella pneumoniae]|uniref:YgdI/YgdR family lipoprotein n=1 Tax=Klebsiella pneumoniae TaxID=573 RepID=UPI000DF39BEE|nr:YgdI/YgdR family lipoprotein [Klebsiella pneumoniae]
MKKIFVSVFAAAVALSALTGCTRTSYAIHTNDGRTIVSDGKPKESDSGLLGYTDANGSTKAKSFQGCLKSTRHKRKCGIL